MKSLKRRAAVLTAAIMLMITIFAVPACADSAVTVNGQSAAAGDTVTFAVYISGVSEPVEAAGSYIKYDPKSLEYIDGSIGFDVFRNAIYNPNEGNIYFSAIDVINGFDLKDEVLAVKLSFKVLDGAKGDLKIEQTFDEIFTMTNEDEDLTPDDYTLRTETTVNTYEKNDAPFAGVDANNIEEMQTSSETDFDNFMLGTDKDELNASANQAQSETQTGSSAQTAPNETEQTSAAAADSTASAANSSAAPAGSEPQTDSDSAGSNVAIVGIIFAVLVVGAVVLAVVVRKKGEEE